MIDNSFVVAEPAGSALMGASREAVERSVTVIMGTVIALTFLFGFGNVLTLGLRLAYLHMWRRWWLQLLISPSSDCW